MLASPLQHKYRYLLCSLNNKEKLLPFMARSWKSSARVETKLPTPAKKRGTASIVLVALALVSKCWASRGAKLKGVYRETAEIYTSAQDEYGHSIQEILRRRLKRREPHQTGGLCGQHSGGCFTGSRGRAGRVE